MIVRSKQKLVLDPAITLTRKDPGYRHPSIHDVMKVWEHSRQTKISGARKLLVSENNWREWTVKRDDNDISAIPYTLWRLLLIQYGVIN